MSTPHPTTTLQTAPVARTVPTVEQQRVLDRIDDIHFATLTSDDVVRHSLVGRIVDAYTKYDEVKQARRYEREQTDKPQPGPADRPRRKR